MKFPSLLLVLSYASYAQAGEPIGLPHPEEPLSLLVYKMEVLNYCGLIDDEISEKFGQIRDQIISSQNISPEDAQKARTKGWQYGLAEWQNRGLGGFRNWCKTEGNELVNYFRNSHIATE